MLTHIQKRKAVELFKITFFQLIFRHFEGVWIKDTLLFSKGILSFGILLSFSFCALLLTLHSCLEALATALYFRLVDGRIRINMSVLGIIKGHEADKVSSF